MAGNIISGYGSPQPNMQVPQQSNFAQQGQGGYGLPAIPQINYAQPRPPGYGNIGATQSSMDVYNRQDPVAAQSKGMINPGNNDAFAALPDWAKKTFQTHYARQGQGELANQFYDQRDVGIYNQFGAGHDNLQNPWAFTEGGMDPTQFNIFSQSSIGNNPYANWNNQQFSGLFNGAGGDKDTFDIWAQSHGGNKGLYSYTTPQQIDTSIYGDKMSMQHNMLNSKPIASLTDSGINLYKNYLAERDGSKRDVWTGARV